MQVIKLFLTTILLLGLSVAMQAMIPASVTAELNTINKQLQQLNSEELVQNIAMAEVTNKIQHLWAGLHNSSPEQLQLMIDASGQEGLTLESLQQEVYSADAQMRTLIEQAQKQLDKIKEQKKKLEQRKAELEWQSKKPKDLPKIGQQSSIIQLILSAGRPYGAGENVDEQITEIQKRLDVINKRLAVLMGQVRTFADIKRQVAESQRATPVPGVNMEVVSDERNMLLKERKQLETLLEKLENLKEAESIQEGSESEAEQESEQEDLSEVINELTELNTRIESLEQQVNQTDDKEAAQELKNLKTARDALQELLENKVTGQITKVGHK